MNQTKLQIENGNNKQYFITILLCILLYFSILKLFSNLYFDHIQIISDPLPLLNHATLIYFEKQNKTKIPKTQYNNKNILTQEKKLKISLLIREQTNKTHQIITK